MSICALAFNFAGEIPGGSAPYKTGFDVEVNLSSDGDNVVGAAVAWWEAATTFRGYLASALGIPTVTLVGEFSGVVTEWATVAATPPSGSVPDLPGASIRAIKIGNRPAGGRRGSMFWPGVSGSITSGNGALDSTPRTNIRTALEDLREDLEASAAGVYIVQRHNVAGSESTTAVVDWDVAPTLTWMQRRYRR